MNSSFSKSTANRLLIFVHYNPHNELSSHVLYTLGKMHPYFKKVIFVSNSILDKEEKDKVQKYTAKIKIRKNNGYDFGAWKEMILEEGWDALKKYDSLTIMNDSCFGPICDMETVFDKMEVAGVDFWGLTNVRESKMGVPVKGNQIPEHIQSYYICFNNNIICSSVFQKFWEKLLLLSDIDDVINRYETQLTKILMNAGFSYEVFRNTKDLKNRHPNIALFSPDFLIESGCPFIKIKSFLSFPDTVYLLSLFEKTSCYPVQMIEDYFNQTFNPNKSLKILNKSIFVSPGKKGKERPNINIAILTYVFRLDVFEEIFDRIEGCDIICDLFIITDNSEKSKQIYEKIHKSKIANKLKDVIIYEDCSSVVLPWLKFSDKLLSYDVVGYFNTHRVLNEDDFIENSWLSYILDSLINPFDDIIGIFEKNKDIGIIIPDITHCVKFTSKINFWNKNKKVYESLWTKITTKKSINFKKINMPVMPLFCMLWYRPKALSSLSDIKRSVTNFSNGPLTIEKEIEFAIETLPVYLAWSAGYDYRIVTNKNNTLSLYELFIRNDFWEIIVMKNAYIDSIYQSYTYRIGQIFTEIPKCLSKLFKKK